MNQHKEEKDDEKKDEKKEDKTEEKKDDKKDDKNHADSFDSHGKGWEKDGDSADQWDDIGKLDKL